ncbi:MAG: UDP-glucose 4-epimerase GalE [Oscillospiraceae bacterium]|nr:UDP-glucose 4-epimerase GalE [Oscillospiraceae bacterium]
MNVLVCGGAGYIGSHAVIELLEAGHNVIVFDNLEKGHRAAVAEDATLVVGDLRDPVALEGVFADHSIDAVMHFAAYSLVGESVTQPDKYYDNNVYGSYCLLQAMRKFNVNKIVFSSTAATYGEPEQVPITEEQKTVPTNPYGETKLAVEKMLGWYDRAYGLKSMCLRYFNVAGAHESGTIGEDHTPETHLIPLVLGAALGKTDCIRIFGTDYDTPDGTCIRDYIHVSDLAAAHVLALAKLCEPGAESNIYNLGYGHGFSNLEILEAARRVTGIPIRAEMADRRPGDPSILIASSDAVVRDLGFAPRYDDLDVIIQSAWAFFKAHPNGYES